LAPLAATPLLVLVQPTLGDVVADAEISSSVYLLTQTRVVVRYLRLLVLPVGQNFDYDFALSKSLAEPAVLLSIALLLAVAAFAALLLLHAFRTRRGAGLLGFFGVAWAFVTLSVESSVVPIKDVIVEHRMYLPSVGAAVAFGTALLWGLERLRLRAALGLQCAVALLLSCGPLAAATFRRNAVWKDELTLWTDVVAKSPRKARPHHSLALAHLARGAPEEAVREFLIALRIRPWYPEALTNLGNAYAGLGQFDDAMRQYRRAVLVAPRLAEAHNNLGTALERAGERDEAVREYREAVRLDPNLPEPKANLRRLEPHDRVKREQP
jgi:tetratricopeptide (TPR) repeat protein